MDPDSVNASKSATTASASSSITPPSSWSSSYRYDNTKQLQTNHRQRGHTMQRKKQPSPAATPDKYINSPWNHKRSHFLSKAMLTGDVHGVIEEGERFKLHVKESQGFHWNVRLFDRYCSDDEDEFDGNLPVREIIVDHDDSDDDDDDKGGGGDSDNSVRDRHRDNAKAGRRHSQHSQQSQSEQEDIFMLED